MSGRLDGLDARPSIVVVEFNFVNLRVARGRGHRFGRFQLVLDQRLRFLIFLFGVAHLDTALEDRAFFDAEAMRDHIAREHAFAADVKPVRALDVALHLAHDDQFFGGDARRDVSVAADSDAVVGKVNRAFDASVNENRFRTRHFTLDDERASDVGLIHG